MGLFEHVVGQKAQEPVGIGKNRLTGFL